MELQAQLQVAEYYADKASALLSQSGFFVEPPSGALDSAGIQMMCVSVNNTEQVRRVLKELPEKLALEDLAQRAGKAEGAGTWNAWRADVEGEIEQVDASLAGNIDKALERLVSRRGEALQRHLFHLAWSPGGCEAELAAKPLLEELDSWLMEYHRWLLHRNFLRLLRAQLAALVAQFQVRRDRDFRTTVLRMP